MKKLLIVYLIIVYYIGCNSKITHNLKGTWQYGYSNYVGVITFQDDIHYESSLSYDDIIAISSGCYFITTNPKRRKMTVLLIPDRRISGNDTILPDCFYIDVQSVTETEMRANSSFIDIGDSLVLYKKFR